MITQKVYRVLIELCNTIFDNGLYVLNLKTTSILLNTTLSIAKSLFEGTIELCL